MKNIADAIFFAPDVCVEAPQTSCDPIGEIVITNFSPGVSAQSASTFMEEGKIL